MIQTASDVATGRRDIPWVLEKFRWMREERIWPNGAGYFCRQPGLPDVKFAFTNYGVSLGLQAAGAWEDRVERLNAFFDSYRSGDEYDREAITHVMGCTSHFPGLFLGSAVNTAMRESVPGRGADPSHG